MNIIPYTTHDSSLSYIIHSIICSRIGDTDQAYEFFGHALDIDLEDSKKEAAEGIHIANCGGIWQAVVIGFAGMNFSYESNRLTFRPNLPKHWEALRFKLVYQGESYTVIVKENQVELVKV
jgi:kojibiose phosphorylase